MEENDLKLDFLSKLGVVTEEHRAEYYKIADPESRSRGVIFQKADISITDLPHEVHSKDSSTIKNINNTDIKIPLLSEDSPITIKAQTHQHPRIIPYASP